MLQFGEPFVTVWRVCDSSRFGVLTSRNSVSFVCTMNIHIFNVSTSRCAAVTIPGILSIVGARPSQPPGPRFLDNCVSESKSLGALLDRLEESDQQL